VRFDGKAVIVTGGASGIGRETVGAFAAAGARVAVLDRNGEGAQQAAHELKPPAIALVADVADPVSIDRAMAEADARLERIDVLVHCAGIGLQKPFLDTTLEEWNRLISTNLTGSFLTCQAAARRMIRNGQGRIINISSVAGERGGTGRAAYGASKAGQTLLTKVMAVELAPHGITVNAIAPGAIETELVARMHTAETRAAYVRCLAIRRYGTPGEVAGAALFLASDGARYVTGEVLHVDGGFTAAGVMF
jgi:NAD(P)-dependent dehydrogenase (short-subunit alcohol dehydrogenase family)